MNVSFIVLVSIAVILNVILRIMIGIERKKLLPLVHHNQQDEPNKHLLYAKVAAWASVMLGLFAGVVMAPKLQLHSPVYRYFI